MLYNMKKFILKTRQGLKIKTWKTPTGYTRKSWQYTPWKTVEMFATFISACKKLKSYKIGLQQAAIYFNGKVVADLQSDEFAKLQTNNCEHVRIVDQYEKKLRNNEL